LAITTHTYIYIYIYGVHARYFWQGKHQIYGHIRYFWQGIHQIYGHIRRLYTVLDNPTCTLWLMCRLLPFQICVLSLTFKPLCAVSPSILEQTTGCKHSTCTCPVECSTIFNTLVELVSLDINILFFRIIQAHYLPNGYKHPPSPFLSAVSSSIRWWTTGCKHTTTPSLLPSSLAP
jgi:hypothetical protein